MVRNILVIHCCTLPSHLYEQYLFGEMGQQQQQQQQQKNINISFYILAGV